MSSLNVIQVDQMNHALRNQNRFYTETNDSHWNELVQANLATKHPGWEEDMSYFRVTAEGKEAFKNKGSDAATSEQFVKNNRLNYIKGVFTCHQVLSG
ncbi:hypothetical protein [Priestia megaterium]